MFCGQLPFRGEHEQLVLYSVLNACHEPITSLRGSIPPELERIIDKCLEKDPAERYQTADELFEDLRWLKRETESGAVASTHPARLRVRRKNSRFFLIPMLAVLIAAGFLAGYFLLGWFKPFSRWKTSIAVLPVENASPREENESLSISTTRDIIFKLTEFSPDLRVIPFDSMKRYKDSEKESIEIGKELGVEYVLASSLMREGREIRMISELIEVESNTNILPFSHVFELEQLFDAQDKISRDIVEKLGVHFAESGYIAAKKREPANVEAYRWYIQGMEVIDNRDIYADPDEWFSEAMRMLELALDLDPNYALAYWGKGAAREAYYVAKQNAADIELAIKHFEKAYELNPGLAEANLALGWAYFYKENLDEAVRSFRRALDISPDSPLINCDVGVFLLSIGPYRHALKFFKKAMQVEPSYLRAYELCSSCCWYIGEYEEGEEMTRKALELGGSYVQNHLDLARHLIMLKRLKEAEEAIQEAEKFHPASPALDYHRALLFAARHDRWKALEFMRGAEESHLYFVTCAYAMLGMKEEAIKNIQRGIEVGFKENQHYMYTYLILKENPCYDILSTDPRFKELVGKEKEIYYRRLHIAKDLL